MITTKNVREKCLETYNLLRQNHKKDYQLNIDEISNEVMVDLVNSDLKRMEEIMKLDVITYEHGRSVGILAEKIAKLLGISLDGIFISSLFHDIGKIFNGKYNEAIQFSDSEYFQNLKAEHILVNEIIAELKRRGGKKLPWHVENCMVSHHNRKDGYPHKSFALGPICQLVEVVDTYDAMARRGGYQRYYSDGEIVDYLEHASQKGMYNIYFVKALKKILGFPVEELRF
jgi:response regulator RpfG family c-di-GMP phosphodiesterase